jgi:short-subunit dehydrogenase
VSGQRYLIVGATSDLARAISGELARQGAALTLAARDTAEAELIAGDLRLRHDATVSVRPFDARPDADYDALFDDDALTGVVVCHGYLGDQQAAQADPAEHRRVIDINYTTAALLLDAAARFFEPKGRGLIVALSSVAGDRGRASNYAYGAAKAGLTAYLSGLRARLQRRGVHVLTVKPGVIDTAMTFGLSNARRAAPPQRVGRDVVRAMRRKRNVIYTPWPWRLVMTIIRLLPEPLFKRTRF